MLGKDSIVIADGLNYIKGFRYQLYCESKASETPSCVVSFVVESLFWPIQEDVFMLSAKYALSDDQTRERID